MGEKPDGRVHYLWVVVAGLGAALLVTLGAVAYNYSRGPGKATMTPEQEREHIIDHITRQVIAKTAHLTQPGEDRYPSVRKYIEFDHKDTSLDAVRKYAIEQYGYRPTP